MSIAVRTPFHYFSLCHHRRQ